MYSFLFDRKICEVCLWNKQITQTLNNAHRSNTDSRCFATEFGVLLADCDTPDVTRGCEIGVLWYSVRFWRQKSCDLAHKDPDQRQLGKLVKFWQWVKCWKLVIINPSTCVCSFLLRASEYSSWDNWRDVLRGTVWEFRHRRDWRHGHGSGESSDREYSESFTVNQDVCGNFLFYYKSLQITLRAFKVQPVDYVITNY